MENSESLKIYGNALKRIDVILKLHETPLKLTLQANNKV